MAEQQQQEAPMKTYRGNCHCKAFVYEITLPEIKQATECNCSVCYKKAALWVFPKPTDVKVIKGSWSDLTDYKFNTGKYTHKFCPTCGVSLMVQGYVTPLEAGEDRLPDNGINVRTFQHGQVDPWTLDLKSFDGKNYYSSTHEGPKFTGPEPTVEVEGGHLYTGGCHCGAVTVAMKAKPINKDNEGLIECSCSICARYGATWDYQPHTSIVIEGRENITSYAFGMKIAVKKFCKICGVVICSEPAENITAEDEAAMTEGTRQWWERSKTTKAINLRVFHDLDVKELSPIHFDGFNYIKLPRYEEP